MKILQSLRNYLNISGLALLLACLVSPHLTSAQTFQLSYTKSARTAQAEPITGRVYLFIARSDKEEPRLQAGAMRNSGRVQINGHHVPTF